ncbi:lactosylceramide 4-alpha-galactosyltransferase-like isoform X2 [Drosophila obscura]|uniref:lactosylceramide 4-alpha-galactosyltransferase-like isoform X2 n=1 Tax=Drosophila obscura TaxID=7282 RepID=UPI001BB2AE54|nr:lactosylceramide 4-alpha-galactosyltransferase-like isoform X2 [Drosophila obscura]
MLQRRFRLLFVSLNMILMGGLALAYAYSWQNAFKLYFSSKVADVALLPQSVETSADLLASIRLDDVLLAEPRPTPGRSIFFHETSCYDARNEENYILKLNARQACAIESAALHNPNFQVFVLFADPDGPVGQYNGIQQPLVDALLNYSNVHLRRLNVWRYAAGTPIEEWLNAGKLFGSRFMVVHIADFLRYLTLFRYGGLYLDLDVVVLQNMEDMPPNYAGAESNLWLANGVMRFSHNGSGHDMVRACLRDFELHFNGYEWGTNGPGVITRVAKQICGTNHTALMQDDRERCKGFKVYGKGAFYAVAAENWRDFFEPDKLEQTMALTKYSYLVHLWNRNSKVVPIKVGSKCAYAKYAEKHCPLVYHATGEYF